ncbi:hypothetical protein CBR_g47163 [Chara braunii]|uniref:Uncharacterized protein n=1 Tax=Chara braunii TaxID=69332 RepID=A0A388M1P8_CHABU|nr:hypothetical protein CBR_g47163 [Chara braunii]|eukprot:GBG88466.1 hypothetical protein CBR_g47163 [Chara braunii]
MGASEGSARQWVEYGLHNRSLATAVLLVLFWLLVGLAVVVVAAQRRDPGGDLTSPDLDLQQPYKSLPRTAIQRSRLLSATMSASQRRRHDFEDKRGEEEEEEEEKTGEEDFRGDSGASEQRDNGHPDDSDSEHFQLDFLHRPRRLIGARYNSHTGQTVIIFVGAVGGCFVVLTVIILIMVCCKRRRDKKEKRGRAGGGGGGGEGERERARERQMEEGDQFALMPPGHVLGDGRLTWTEKTTIDKSYFDRGSDMAEKKRRG